MSMDAKQEAFLERYLNELSQEDLDRHFSVSSGYFCADKDNANICADLVLAGTKTATCSMQYWYESAGEPAPSVGHLQVVTDWDGAPVCIIETLEVQEEEFGNVPQDFARAEGEGDKSLAWWREAHWNHFSRECDEIGIEATEEMVLVLERFRVVFS